MRTNWRPPLRLPVRVGEHALSYLVRLGVRNGDTNSARFASDLGVSIDGLRTGREVGILEHAAQLRAGSLAAWSPQVQARSRTLALGSETIRLRDWDGSSRRWCPSCFTADRFEAGASSPSQPDRAPYHRAVWDLSHLSSCPDHGSPLKSRCPSCGETQGWTHAPLDVCACGRRLTSEKSSDASPDALSRFLNARVHGTAIDEPTLLAGQPLSKCLPLLERLGLAAIGEPGCEWASISNYGADRCASHGFDVAMKWPHAFVNVLDRVLSRRDDAARSPGMTLAYGWIHEYWIQPLPEIGTGRELKSVLSEHAISNGIMAAGEAILGQNTDTSSVTLKEAARQLCMGHERARGLLMRNGALPLGRRRSVGMPIHRSDVERLREDRGRRLDARSARNLLGVGRKAFGGLVRSGLIAPVDDGLGNERFVAGEVAAIPREIGLVGTRLETVPEGCLTLFEASRNFGIPVSELARRISAGELKPHGAVGASPTFGDTVLFAADLHRPSPTAEGELTLQQAAKLLRLHPEAVLHLARTDLLTGKRQGRSWAFEEKVVLDFGADHVAASKVAKRLGTSPRAAIERLASIGIRPVVGPPACRQAVFRKDADERATGLLA